MPEDGSVEAILVSLAAAIVIVAVGAWLTGQLAAFMFSGAWPSVSLTGSLHAALRLPGHLADPRDAWPVTVRGKLPGTAQFYVGAMIAVAILGFGTAAVARRLARKVADAYDSVLIRRQVRVVLAELGLEDRGGHGSSPSRGKTSGYGG